MSTNARQAIFDAIRRGLEKSGPQERRRGDFGVSKPFETADRASGFATNLSAIGGNCVQVADRAEAAAAVAKILGERSSGLIAISDDPLVVEIATGIEREFVQRAAAEELFDCAAGFTSAQFGIAETGTLVIDSEREFNRLTSLIPPVHVCVLPASRIVNNLGEVLAALQDGCGPSVTFITGQSRTSDIELTLALGVHGPKEIWVIVIENE